jgi:putative acetyltransferase
MSKQYLLREARPADLDQVTALFRDTILHVSSKHYDPGQIHAWSAGAENKQRWNERLANQYFLLAFEESLLTGFSSITKEGYLDTMYVHKDFQHMGVATCLLNAIESWARGLALSAISSDVSITARPFFESKGFRVLAEQQVEIRGQVFTNYKMQKQLRD